MKLARFSVDRPIFTSMITLIVLIIGGVSLMRLPIDLLPDVTYPTITVSTQYENASPEEMEELVTRLVEQAVAAVPGVDQMISTSGEGASSVRITFTWGTDLNEAANDIRNRLERFLDDLPDGADRPQVRKYDVSQYPIVIIGVASRMDAIELHDLVDQQIRYRLERLPGVAAADIFGGLEREIHVNLDYNRIKALGLAFDRIIDALRTANLNVPAGEIYSGNYEVTIRTPGQFTTLAQLGETVVATRDGAPIHLNQIANIEDTHRKITRIIRINGEPGMRLGIRKQSGTNTVQVAKAVHREIDRINADYPQLRLVPVLDTAQYIERSINNVGQSVLYGGALAVLVLLFFLRNLRSTFVVTTAIPISIIATFSLIYFGGYTLNLMTLGGLALGVGMMVDNAIVVLENIYRHKELGADNRQAAVHGADEVTAAIIASTLTTLVIFLPLTLVRGVSGVLFSELAYVISFALICSLGVALTLVPMLSSRVLRPVGSSALARTPPLSWVMAAAQWALQLLEDGYRGFISGALRWRLVSLTPVVAVFAGCIALIPLIGTEFMPATDEGEVRVEAEAEVGTRLDLLDQRMHPIEKIVVASTPEIDNWVADVGASSYRPGNAGRGQVRVALAPVSQRARSSEQIAAELRRKLAQRPGLTIRTRAGQGLFLLRRLLGSDEGVQIEVRGFELDVLDEIASEAARRIKDVAGVTDVRLTREAGVPQQLFHIDREKAADLGLSVAQIAHSLETAIAGTRAGGFRRTGYEYRIIVKLRDSELLDLQDILNLTLTNDRGEQVVLRNVVDIEPKRGPIQIQRKDQQRIAVVSANIADRDLGSIARDIEAQLKSIPMPRGYEANVAGDYEEQEKAFAELALSLVLSLVLVYMVMACLYESLIDPLVVMFSVPLAVIGVVLTLFLTNTTFNVQSYIGCIMLGGIVVNNAILIVDQTDRLRREDKLLIRPALVEACSRRLRPILMTSATTILGLLPLALGFGEGAEAQAPLARAVIGGLLSSTLITLLVIPIVYSLMHRERAAA